MNKYEIIKKIEKFAPPENAEAWDCVGFMVETAKTDINKVMLCLTPTENVIRQAKEQNCDMIISHHPMFEINCHSELVSESFLPQIDIYSAHTNMDLAQGGTTDTLIDNFINLFESEMKLEIFKQVQDKMDFVRYIEFENLVEVDEIAKILSKISPNLRYVNNNDTKFIKKIGFCAGSGSEFIKQAQENSAGCFVTGDLKFHTALDSEILVFDIGHFESEILILPVFEKIIGEGIEIIYANEKSPFINPI
ncbi:Nif3-like dinuclear metal center hexameric protein [bacterium]|nr:Nif3-like dinuclear metal center hexameric protein [bacterium]